VLQHSFVQHRLFLVSFQTMIFRLILLMCISLSFMNEALATHNRAGEITYRHLGGFQYEATIITYTKLDSPADRPELGISWGDGSIDTIPRINGNGLGEILSLDIKKNIYVGVHTFPAPSVYVISFEDPNRNGGVVNIPNSINIPFFVSTELIINPFLGVNNSVQLLNPPIDQACPGQIFIHNPGAYDPDGDSISYRIVSCRGENGVVIPGFVQPVSTNSFTLNPVTGDLIWDTPPLSGIGEYNVAFIIEEWRNGILIGSVTRDMQIDVVPCQNQPPTIIGLPDLCVDAGTSIGFEVLATDSDNPSQLVTLSATGGPFLFDSPGNAVFTAITGQSSAVQSFTWNTSCDHVRREPYLITFKAIDNGQPNLAYYETMQVQVVAQAPENLTSSPQGNTISLNWEISPCTKASGYAIYRRNGFYGFQPDQCETGVPAYTGYQLIDTVNGLNSLSYIDGLTQGSLLPGRSYCYMVIALFPDGAESYASNETCVELADLLPVVTHVSIDSTALSNGRVYVEWSKPDDLDLVQWPGPYQYVLQRAQGLTGSSFVDVATLSGLNDTTYLDSDPQLNTLENAWSYKIRLEQISNGVETIGSGLQSSSVFLLASGSDNTINLSWNFDVLWENDTFIVYRKNNQTGIFDSIGTTQNRTFSDTGLANGVTYCYRVLSSGAFTASGFENPLLNYSQEVCSSAQDLTPPCPPPVLIFSSCDSLSNILQWSPSNEACASDVLKYRIYFKPLIDKPFELIDSTDLGTFSFEHLPGWQVAGCYKVVAVDSTGNESNSLATCADNCPEYSLPNVFSPNGDGFNDAFRPFPYAFIESVSFIVYNRWGIEVFETTNPDLLWNGRLNNSGALVPDGVYFYICVVNELRLTGIVQRTLKGTIQIIGSNNTPID
jgi:gliding motility-associated-like protein